MRTFNFYVFLAFSIVVPVIIWEGYLASACRRHDTLTAFTFSQGSEAICFLRSGAGEPFVRLSIALSAGLALFVYATAADASDWWYLATTGGPPDRGVEFAEAASSVTLTGHKVRGWSLTYFERFGRSIRALKYEKILQEYNCSTRTAKLLSWVDLDATGNVIDSSMLQSYEATPQALAPDSIGETRMNFFCSGNRDNAIQFKKFDPVESSKSILNSNNN